MTAIYPRLFSRSLSRRRPGWQTALVCAGLLALPFLAAALDGVLDDLPELPALRPLLLPPVIISYILLTAPLMARGEADMVRRLRPVVLVDDDRYARLVAEASRVHPGREIAAVGVGALVGFGLTRGWGLGEASWLNAYLVAGVSLMFGVLAWTIYDSVVSTRLLAALHSQPMAIDLLDLGPFEPVGRQSLLSTLIFLGGILLGMLFGLDWGAIREWRVWLAYAPLAAVVVVLFFLSMRDTHRVLSEAKARELDVVGQRLRLVSARYRSELAAGAPAAETSAALSGLLAYEQRVAAAPTWPYNPTMLQTLLFSILSPLVVKGVTWVLFEQ